MKVILSKPYANLVFRNLVNNAVKYNFPKGKIRIESTFHENEVIVSITDTGVGIRPEIIDKIWGELYIGDPSRHDPLSKGFGLPIVKKIVELHQGKLRYLVKEREKVQPSGFISLKDGVERVGSNNIDHTCRVRHIILR